jgi:hypothetical protein
MNAIRVFFHEWIQALPHLAASLLVELQQKNGYVIAVLHYSFHNTCQRASLS